MNTSGRRWAAYVLGWLAAAAVSVTPVGGEWADSLAATFSDLYHQALGLFS